MNQNFRHFLKLLWQSVLFWTLAMFCYAMFRHFGTYQEIAYSLNEGFDAKRALRVPLLILTVMGFALGILYALVDFLFEKYIPKKISLGLGLLIKTLLHFVATIIVINAVGRTVSKIFEVNVDFEFGWWVYEKRFWSAMFFIIVSSFVFSFIKIATERFGRGMFLKMLLGTYTKPKEEKRIFMFLDLKDSTTIAEKLGHQLYSQFIQDCFFDLNEVVLEYEAEIYQYVGDEAVLSWPYKKGLHNNNCIGLFFAFQHQRQSKQDYYLKKYDVFPEIKAGLHGGELMVAEVGHVKKELAYHGDVINTSASIQAKCNVYNVTILLSEKLLRDLKLDKVSKSQSLGKVLLKGKHEEVKIHTIRMV
jgi:adenylate cyclase